MSQILQIGIYTQTTIPVVFHGAYKGSDGKQYEGKHILQTAVHISPEDTSAYFELEEVCIGLEFHWERKENQCFKGALECKPDGKGAFIAINHVSIEDYLCSVISSEMSASSSLELLKAHAVISRGWAMSQILPKEKHLPPEDAINEDGIRRHIKWYDRENHELFHLCADDHCQRYQGITKTNNSTVVQAVEETKDEVLAFEGKICDTRFYKCCGGVTEAYEYCWDNTHYPYLTKVRDTANNDSTLDLRKESNARKWILGEPRAFCNTKDKHILTQVLNDFDQETNDFYRWEQVYSPSELSKIILNKSGIDVGEVIDLLPLQRGVSGRITELQICGSKGSLIIGKELEIRKFLSTSHLYSSAFVVSRNKKNDFVLKGAGWGHGVGLCQIGAAVMADKGYHYKEILAHYYPNSYLSHIQKLT